jgi:endonuclease/exonuclease/phosphatase family metal-dependent hydrolase
MKLVTWNIQWGRGADGRVDLDRIVADAKRITDFDVLCLQEVAAGYPELPGCDGSDQFQALAARLPGYKPIEGIATDTPHPAGGRRRFGNLMLSRLPVRQVFRHLLPWPADPGVKSMQRTAVEATLETSFGLLRVITTHLEYYSLGQRAAQVERLRELQHEGHAHGIENRPGTAADGAFAPEPRGVPALLAGDFNFEPDAPERARLVADIDAATPAWRDAWEIVHPGLPHAPTVGLHDKRQWPGPPFTWDYVFASADLAQRVAALEVDASSAASDHQPVLVALRP